MPKSEVNPLKADPAGGTGCGSSLAGRGGRPESGGKGQVVQGQAGDSLNPEVTELTDMTDDVHCLPADSEQDKPGKGVPIFLPDRMARWQTQSRCKFTLLVDCEVAMDDRICHEFDSPVPVQLQTWLAESITKQHALLSLPGCDSEALLAGLQHAQRVTAVQDSTVMVVLSTAQRYRLISLHPAVDVQVLGRCPRGSELYRSAV